MVIKSRGRRPRKIGDGSEIKKPTPTYIKDVVGELIGEENVEEWLDTSVPSLMNFTPRELMRYGKIELVEELVDSYNDPSYS